MVLRVTIFCLFLGLFALLPSGASLAGIDRPITLSFEPKEGYFERYMTVISLGGTITKPNSTEDLGWPMPQYRLRAVYRDTVEGVLRGMNRHSITFYDYDIISLPTPEQRRRRERGGRPPQGPAGGGPPVGGGGGGGGPAPSSAGVGSYLPPGGLFPLQEPNTPMQGLGPGGGGPGGPGAPSGPPAGLEPTFSIDDILVTNLEFVESKRGDILDIRGQSLDLLREYSRHAVTPGEIKLDISHLFEWTHLLRLPDYPVWREDIWFATVPVTVPGLPKPLPFDFIYRLVGFTRVGMREIAIIDADATEQFHEYWEEDLPDKLVKYEAMGMFTIGARYLFDIKNGTVFGIERPPLFDYVTLSFYPGSIGEIFYQYFEFKYPGLFANLDMRYYTEETKKKKTRFEQEQKPKLERRHVALTFFMQTEAE